MDQPERRQTLRRLPKVDEVLRQEPVARLLDGLPRWAVVQAVRDEIEGLRQGLLAAEPAAAPADGQAEDGPANGQAEDGPLAIDAVRVRRAAAALVRPPLRRVINATGVVLHTGLGRAPLCPAALQRIADLGGGYCDLELDLMSGARGSRQAALQGLLGAVTGAEAHLVVNNNAAAVLLMLAGLCAGREVVLSRGELVEIGGSFRVPDVMAQSGALLREVGTTNRTRLGDYEAACEPQTAALLKVHRSNFAVVGFTCEVALADLSRAARARGLLCLFDLGSGALLDPQALNPELSSEPTVRQAVAAGADVVCFSGDKLLGGPQAGILAGRADLIGALGRHPLLRALRPDKLQLLALSATLEQYRDGAARAALPVLRMMAAEAPALGERAEALRRLVLEEIGSAGGEGVCEVMAVRSAVGGGSLPLSAPGSFAVAVAGSAERLGQALRDGEPAVLGRIIEGRLCCDVRTVSDAELPALGRALAVAWARATEGAARA